MQVLGKKYRLGELIYTSELSWVYEASFALNSREAKTIPLIVKTLPRARQDEGRAQMLKQRIQSEAQALANLDNPFIVKVIAYGEDAGIPYLVMRRRKLNLSEYLQNRGKLSLTTAIPLLYNLATALDYAHQQGFIHRDIKPDNILLDLDEAGQPLYPYLTDFGIAQFQERSFRTQTNQIMGTMAYMPPERWEGKETTRLSDIYSFGLVAYEMLVGTSLLKSNDAVQVQMAKIMNPSPAFLQGIKARLDPDVASIILKAIARHPEDRYQSATEFVDSLGKLLAASHLDQVNQVIARNHAQAGLADEAALRFNNGKRRKFSLVWLTAVAALTCFLVGVIWAQFKPKGSDALAEVTAEISEVLVVANLTAEVTELIATNNPASTLTSSFTPSATASATATLRASSSASPSPTASQTASPSSTYTPSITPTPLPEVDCEGAGWIFHSARQGDSLSHYVFSLASHPIFSGLNYEQRRTYIISVNAEVDFSRLRVGDLVCLPTVPPQYVAAPSPTVLSTGGSLESTPLVSDTGGGSSSSGGGSSGGGTGGSSPTSAPPPTAIPINVSVSSSCGNGNSGSTTFRISNNGSTTVNISWRVTEGGNAVASGSLSLNAGESATAWSGNTKNKNYSLTVNETGASSGESCG